MVGEDKEMIVYLALFCLICLFYIYPYMHKNSEQSIKIYLFVSFFAMALVVGLRPMHVGEDTNHYVHIFNQAQYLSWREVIPIPGLRTPYYTDVTGYTDTIESGWLFLCKLIQIFTMNAQIYLLIIALLTFFLVAKFIYENCDGDVFLSTLVVLCESFFMNSFNGMRQLFAVAITLQAYTMFKRKRDIQGVGYILLGMCFHNVSIAGGVLYPILKIKKKNYREIFKYIMVISLMFPVIIFCLKNVIAYFFPRYGAYFTDNYWEVQLGGSAIFLLVECIFVLVMYRYSFSKGADAFALSVLALLNVAMIIGALEMSILERAGFFYRIYLVLFFPTALKYFDEKSKRVIFLIIFILLFLFYLSYAKTPWRINYI